MSDQSAMRDFFQKQLKAILIDFDDTLVDYRSAADKALIDLFDNSGIPLQDYPEAANDYNEINHRLWPMLERGEASIDIIRCQRFEEMQQKYPLVGLPCDLDVYYRSRFVVHSELITGTMEFMHMMKNRGYKLFVITNGIKETQDARIQNLGLTAVIDGYVTSEDVGKAKPNPLMLNYALQQLGVTNEEAVVIGDSMQSDILGAKNAGIRSILVNRLQGKTELNGHKPDIIVNSLHDIMKFVNPR